MTLEKRIVNWAKYRLMDNFKMSEEEAYEFIRLTAMDQKATKLAIAEQILDKESLLNNAQ